MPLDNNSTLLFENADIMFRNFEGRAQQFNTEGDRNFCIRLSDEQAEVMLKDGWNVKTLKPKEEGDKPQPYIQVAVEYRKGRPPRVILRTSNGANELGADEVGMVDIVDIKTIDVIIRAYAWEVKGTGKGIKAYLKTAVVTINEDELERKYAGELHPADPVMMEDL